jgi:DNA-binding NtrC family response regulator
MLPQHDLVNKKHTPMKQSILVIEENAAMRCLLTTVLNSRYNTIAYSDCYYAVNDLKNKNVRLVIVNIENENSKNLDFLVHLNSSSFYSYMPVIVTSNDNSSETRLKCIELGVEAFFQKPFDPLTLLETVNDVLLLSKKADGFQDDLRSPENNEPIIQVN